MLFSFTKKAILSQIAWRFGRVTELFFFIQKMESHYVLSSIDRMYLSQICTTPYGREIVAQWLQIKSD